MPDLDEAWMFWIRFVFDDGYPYIMLFLLIISGKWKLRMAAIKSMALFAFDHPWPIHQRLISTQIVDMAHVPSKLLVNLEVLLSLSQVKATTVLGVDDSHKQTNRPLYILQMSILIG